jgi:hypothetical protein
LPSNDRGIFTEPLPRNDRGRGYTRTDSNVISLAYFYFFQNKESRLEMDEENKKEETKIIEDVV